MAAAFVPLGQGLLQVLAPYLGNYTEASLLAAAIVTVPNFFANKYFVWRMTARENLRNQVVVFWLVVMLGVSLATWFTNIIDHATADRTTFVRCTAVLTAQLLGLGIVWIGRFLILDRWLFKKVNHERPLITR